jgi:hypothetical protein
VKNFTNRVTVIAIVAGVAILAASATTPARAQTLGNSYRDNCRDTRTAGSAACAHPAGGLGNRDYQRWDDGSAARATGSSVDRSRPQYFRGYNTLYGFGR